MPPITVMHVINSLDIGGTEKQLYLLLKHLDRQRFHPVVVSLSKGGFWVEPIRGLGVELVELKRRGSYEVRRLMSLVGLLQRYKPTILHTWQSPGNLYGGLAGLFFRRSKCILSRRSLDDYRGLRRFVDVFVHRRSNAVVCNSKALAAGLAKRFNGKLNCVVIYNGIETGQPSRREQRLSVKREIGLPEDCKVIGSVGRMVPFKNQRLVIDAAHDVLRHRSDCYFLLVGDGPLRGELEAHARKLKVSDRVIFLGFRKDVAELLTAFDVFLFPSVNDTPDGEVFGEGFPNAVMEAMLARVPCIASTESGADELFSDGEAGFLVDPHSKDDVVEKILTLLADARMCDGMKEKGWAIIRENFSVQPMVSRFETLYDSLIDSPCALPAGFESGGGK